MCLQASHVLFELNKDRFNLHFDTKSSLTDGQEENIALITDRAPAQMVRLIPQTFHDNLPRFSYIVIDRSTAINVSL